LSEKVEVRNINAPHHVTRVDKAKYDAMRDAMLAILTREKPGMTPAEIKTAVLPALPQDLFPGGDKAGWWIKCVQLDLEARGVIVRAERPPVRLSKV